MSKIISVIGNIGVGKTTLTEVISKKYGILNLTEEHGTRPFQQLFKDDQRYGLANQIDYLLLRAEQERIVRDNDTIGIFDGGLDLDFHIFTRLFLKRNLLSQKEYDLCERLYRILRSSLPSPDLTIYIHADLASIESRFQSRDRINIARTQDMREINLLLETYFYQIPENNRIEFDVSNSNPEYPEIIEKLEKIIY